ncbi:hypothetical protein FRC04_009127 [Tulasnella sp. 424]|nr:hypothetical protein FRC04_009127 [Tulasnella sp. 424]KAG8958323.1 hypothetical protein FRC05_009005 [Tulasnella sp. 425]
MRFSVVSSIATVLLSGFFAVASPVNVDTAPAPVFAPRAALTVPAIISNGQTQVDAVTQQIRKVIPYGGNTTQPIDSQLVSSLLSKVQGTIDNVNSQLQQVAGQPWDAISGGADPDTAEYSLADFAISAVKAVAPASAITDKYPELQKSVDAVTTSVTNLGPVALAINWRHFWGWVLIGAGAVLSAIGESLL